MDYETRAIQGTLQAGENRTISGYAAVYNTPSHELPGGFREVIKPGAFAGLTSGDVRALVSHDTSKIIGRTKSGTLELREDDKGLFFSVQVPDTQVGNDLLTSVKRGDMDGASFGFKVKADGYKWRQEPSGPIREISKFSKLAEISIVAFPAYPDTSVAVRSMQQFIKSGIATSAQPWRRELAKRRLTIEQ